MKTTRDGRIIGAVGLGLALIASPFLQAATFTVGNLNDAGAGSLRQAILDANAAPGADTISFSIASGTITLASPLPAITGALTITGPGAASLTVSGASSCRVFVVNAPSATVSISGLTVSDGMALGNTGGWGGNNGGGGGGSAGLGGGLLVVKGAVQLSGMAFNNNQALGGDGGLQGDPATFSTSGWNSGGGGGGGLGGAGGNAVNPNGASSYYEGIGGTGGSGGVLGGTGGAVAANGGNGAGGGGGSKRQNGGDGGFGGGGGGGAGYPDGWSGTRLTMSPTGFSGGAGGFGGGGGGGTAVDAGGGAAGFGALAGHNGSSTWETNFVNTSGGGGGGAGLGGAIFVKDGASVTITGTSYSGNSAKQGRYTNAAGYNSWTYSPAVGAAGIGPDVCLCAIGTSNVAFNYPIALCSAPTGFGLIGTLPAGLTFNTLTGVISGTPTTLTPFTELTVTATNAGGIYTASLALAIAAPSDSTPPTVAIGAPSVALTKAGPVTYAITYADETSFGTSTLAAANITLNKTGTANGTVAVSGSGTTRTVTISSITGDGTLGVSLAAGTATDSAGNAAGAAGPSATFVVDNTAPVITSAASVVGVCGSAFSHTIGASGSPVSYGATGLPAGLSVNPSTGAITGTLTQAGISSITVSATDAVGNTGSAPLTLSVSKVQATVTLSNLTSTYDGTAKSVSVTTTPSGLPLNITYNGAAALPINAGTYAVTATVSHSTYAGGASGTLTIARAAQSIQFALLGPVTIGQPVTLSASAGSSLPITFSVVSGNATIDGRILTVNDGGTVVVRASQAGDNNTSPASSDQTIAVASKLAQTITFAALSDRNGTDAPFALEATASSGLPVTFAVVSGPATLDGRTLTLTGAAGAVIVRASQAGNATYAAAPDVERNFAVANPANRIYFGDVRESGSTAKAGEIAAMLPAVGTQGRLLIVVRDRGLNLAVDFQLAADGSFTTEVAVAPATPTLERPTARAAGTLTVRGRLVGGVLSGAIEPLNLPFSAAVQAPSGPTASLAGYYRSSVLNCSTGSTASIIGPNHQVLVVAQTATLSTGGLTTLAADGSFNLQSAATGGTVTLRGQVDAPTTMVTGTISQTGQPTLSFAGLSATGVRTDRLINFSSRGQITGGANIVITGFVVGGTNPMPVLLRAVGPGLAQFATTGPLAAPRLQLFDSAGKLVIANQGWGGAAELIAACARVGAFPLSAGSADAVVATSLAPGAYTLHITSAGTGTGVALAEIYDASPSPQGERQRLINLSSRGQVGPGAGVLIGGFVVTGNAPKKILVRGAGPALASLFGLADALADPALTVFDRAGVAVAQNDNWYTPIAINSAQVPASAADIVAANTTVGAFGFAAGSKDAAVIVILAPGTYTAIIAGPGTSTGLALVEIYEIPE